LTVSVGGNKNKGKCWESAADRIRNGQDRLGLNIRIILIRIQNRMEVAENGRSL